MLAASDLRITRGGTAIVSHASLVLRPGAITVILGPNGAGKSTLLAALAGLLHPAAGTVTLERRPLADWPADARARAIGYLPQEPVLHWGLTVSELVALGRLPHRGRWGGTGPPDRAAVAAAMAAADVAHLADRRADRLSGGERARVLAARLVAGDPRVVLADEPLANLDPLHQAQMMALFRAQAGEGRAVALVLHDLTAAVRLADEALLMAGGRIVGQGLAAEVLVPARLEPVYGVRISATATADGPALLPGAPIG